MPLGISYPGRLKLEYSPGGVVHIRVRQAEPVPQAPEPFAAGPGDRLFQLPSLDEIGRAVDGAGRGRGIRYRQAAWALIIWREGIPGHCGLLGDLAGLRRVACWCAIIVNSDRLVRRRYKFVAGGHWSGRGGIIEPVNAMNPGDRRRRQQLRSGRLASAAATIGVNPYRLTELNDVTG
jgi:hypothetical protein